MEIDTPPAEGEEDLSDYLRHYDDPSSSSSASSSSRNITGNGGGGGNDPIMNSSAPGPNGQQQQQRYDHNSGSMVGASGGMGSASGGIGIGPSHNLYDIIPPIRIISRLPWAPKVRQKDVDQFLDVSRSKFIGFTLQDDHETLAGLPQPIHEGVKTLKKVKKSHYSYSYHSSSLKYNTN